MREIGPAGPGDQLAKLPVEWLETFGLQSGLWPRRVWDGAIRSGVMVLAARREVPPKAIYEALLEFASEEDPAERYCQCPDPPAVVARGVAIVGRSRPAIAAPDSCREQTPADRAAQLRGQRMFKQACDALIRKWTLGGRAERA